MFTCSKSTIRSQESVYSTSRMPDGSRGEFESLEKVLTSQRFPITRTMSVTNTIEFYELCQISVMRCMQKEFAENARWL